MRRNGEYHRINDFDNGKFNPLVARLVIRFQYQKCEREANGKFMKQEKTKIKRHEFEAVPTNAPAAHGQGALSGDAAIELSQGLPFLLAVTVPSNATLVFMSGHTPPVIDNSAPPDSVAAYGDTETQTVGVFNELKQSLEKIGLSFNSLIKLQVFVVGDPNQNGQMDNAGFSRAYARFFGTAEQPHKVVRTRVQVLSLVNPGWLVEVEAVAAIER